MNRVRVLSLLLDAITPATALRRVLRAALRNQAMSACFANVHMVMEAHDRPEVRTAVRRADLVCPDGMPLVWAIRAQGVRAARVYGPDTSDALCALAARLDLPIGLYGGRPEVLARLGERLTVRHPCLRVVYQHAPAPAEIGTAAEGEELARAKTAGVRMLFIGLGCPKQEMWLARNHEGLFCPTLAVGAWFDFAAGAVAQAPDWMQAIGCEWLFRLSQDPRRLFIRYARHNPRFVWLTALQWLGQDPWRPRRHWLVETRDSLPTMKS